jgi:hypothetical protein
VMYWHLQSSVREISQIWREESRKFKESCYVLTTCLNLLTKYGDFRHFFLEIWGTIFLQKSFVWVALDLFCHQVARNQQMRKFWEKKKVDCIVFCFTNDPLKSDFTTWVVKIN